MGSAGVVATGWTSWTTQRPWPTTDRMMGPGATVVLSTEFTRPVSLIGNAIGTLLAFEIVTTKLYWHVHWAWMTKSPPLVTKCIPPMSWVPVNVTARAPFTAGMNDGRTLILLLNTTFGRCAVEFGRRCQMTTLRKPSTITHERRIPGQRRGAFQSFHAGS